MQVSVGKLELSRVEAHVRIRLEYVHVHVLVVVVCVIGEHDHASDQKHLSTSKQIQILVCEFTTKATCNKKSNTSICLKCDAWPRVGLFAPCQIDFAAIGQIFVARVLFVLVLVLAPFLEKFLQHPITGHVFVLAGRGFRFDGRHGRRR